MTLAFSKVAIIGAGAMGRGIAQIAAQAGSQVWLYDTQAEAIAKARDAVFQQWDKLQEKGRLSAEAVAGHKSRLLGATSLQDLAECELVVEAIVEKLEIKKSLFTDLEKVLPASAVLVTNTSSLSVTAIAAALQRPAQFAGYHFFNPVPLMKVVEVIAGLKTDPAVCQRLSDFARQMGHTPVQAQDTPGFIVNRCARPFYGEALALMGEGRTASDIDAAMQAAGYRLGPLSLIDLIGADINLAATQGMSAVMGHHPRYHVFPALEAQVAKGHLGRKSGQGFLHPAQPGPAPADAAQIALRIEATLINEAHWLLSEGGTTAEGIDTAMKLGLNFPRGPFEALALHGRDAVLRTLAALHSAAPAALKPRYTPAPGLA